MLDLETMGTSVNSAIVSIGAVEFSEGLGITDRFYVNIDLQSCMDKGMEINAKTLMWWMKQSDEARKSLTGDTIPLRDALKSFREWVVKGNENVQIWGNGSDFDNAMISNAYSKFNATQPWNYWDNRCYRTLVYSLPKLEFKRDGTHHNALDDAEYQAKHLIALVTANKLTHVL